MKTSEAIHSVLLGSSINYILDIMLEVSQPTRIILVRHGESEGNAGTATGGNPVIGGATTDFHLTPKGHEQAQEAGRQIASILPIHHIVSSPMKRAYHTAQAIASTAGYSGHIETDHSFIERHFGEMEGKDPTRLGQEPGYMIKSGKKKIVNPDWKPAGGESLNDVKSRTTSALSKLAEKHKGKNIVVVTHGHAIRAMTAGFDGSWEGKRPLNAEIRVFEIHHE